MPKGKGTYGTTKGRPPKKKTKKTKKKY